MSRKLQNMSPEEAQHYMNLLLQDGELEFNSSVEEGMYEKFREMVGLRQDVESRITQLKGMVEQSEKHHFALNSQLEIVGSLLIEVEDERRGRDKKTEDESKELKPVPDAEELEALKDKE